MRPQAQTQGQKTGFPRIWPLGLLRGNIWHLWLWVHGSSYSTTETGRIREDSAARRGSPELDRRASPPPWAPHTEDGVLLHPSRLCTHGGASEHEAGGGLVVLQVTSCVKVGLHFACLSEAMLALCPAPQE